MNRFCIFLILCILSLSPISARGEEQAHRGLFVTVLQDPQVLSSRTEIAELIAFAKSSHIETLFVQIYRANQAWFPSTIADDSPYESCVKKVMEDPMALLIKDAHEAGIQVHAWINLLSLSTNKDALFLKRYGTAILTRNLKKKKMIEDYRIDNQYFLEPGDIRVRQALLKTIEEILRAYPDLDGIQFDYIRYPDKNPAYGYTKMNIERFKRETGNSTVEETSTAWRKWKRDQVTELVVQLSRKARAVHPGIQVSTTGCAPYIRAYHEAFQDWPKWLDRGIIDFVTLMSYSPDLEEFKKFVLDAKNNTAHFDRVNIAIGAYEMVGAPENFAREVDIAQNVGGRGSVIFHYGSLIQDPALTKSLIGPIPNKSTPR